MSDDGCHPDPVAAEWRNWSTEALEALRTVPPAYLDGLLEGAYEAERQKIAAAQAMPVGRTERQVERDENGWIRVIYEERFDADGHPTGRTRKIVLRGRDGLIIGTSESVLD